MSDAVKEARRYLTFSLDKEMFALDISCVREILDYTEITRIPQAPFAVRGVVNVRGAAVPVIDLRMRFGLSEVERTVNTRIIIVETSHGESVTVLGAIADSVKEVLELEPEAISAPPSMGTRVTNDYLVGIGKVGGKFLLILDIAKVLGAEDVLALAELGGKLEG